MSKKLCDYPKELTESRSSVEASFIFCLWKQPDLYDDYGMLNENDDETIKTEDGIFYFSLGKQLYRQGYKSFDNVSVYTFLEDKPSVKKQYEKMGGYSTTRELMELVDVDNTDAYFDQIAKMNTLMTLHDKGFNVLENIGKLMRMTSQEVYDYYDYLLNSVSLKSGHDTLIEDLTIDQAYLDKCDSGEELGLNFGKVCHILNYLTMGLPLGEMTMLAGHSGAGKTSFVFENIVIPLVEQGIKVAIISNEQRIHSFQQLLLVHILTQDLDYWELTRKKLKSGHFTSEQNDMLSKAVQVAAEKYPCIKFVKLFDTDIVKTKKVLRKLSKIGYQAAIYDTMKVEDDFNRSTWEQLLMQSRQLFQLASKENIALVTTFQLALSTLNKRWLDAACLSNGKQVKEVYSEMIYIRQLWDDEYTGEKHDCKAFRLKRDSNGKYLKAKEMVELNRDKKYVVAFLDKTRNDEDKQTVLYEWNGRYNKWVEIGYCVIYNDHSV